MTDIFVISTVLTSRPYPKSDNVASFLTFAGRTCTRNVVILAIFINTYPLMAVENYMCEIEWQEFQAKNVNMSHGLSHHNLQTNKKWKLY